MSSMELFYMDGTLNENNPEAQELNNNFTEHFKSSVVDRWKMGQERVKTVSRMEEYAQCTLSIHNLFQHNKMHNTIQ